MGQFQVRVFDAILERMINRVVARTDLTDINDGSDLKQVLAAAAREDDDQYVQMLRLLDLFGIDTAIGNDLDERARQFNPALITRLMAQKATGEVQFSRTGTVGAVTIAIGTEIEVPAEGAAEPITFITTEEGTISAGNTDSNLVDVVAKEAGAPGNVSADTVTGFVSKPSGVDTVTNPSTFTNGRDLESDDAFRQRLKNSIKGLARAHVDGIESAALGVEDTVTGKRCIFATAVEDPINRGEVTLYIDDGAGTAGTDKTVRVGVFVLASAVGGETVLQTPHKPLDPTATFTLYINAAPQIEGTDYSINRASGQINLLPAAYPTGLTALDAVTADYTSFEGLIAEVQKVIDGDPSDRANYPGYRAAGVRVQVLAPQTVYQTVTGNITVLTNYNQTTVAAAASAAVNAYINGLRIGEDVILNEIRERAMAVPGMYDLQLTAPTSNTVILDTQLARVLSSGITFT